MPQGKVDINPDAIKAFRSEMEQNIDHLTKFIELVKGDGTPENKGLQQAYLDDAGQFVGRGMWSDPSNNGGDGSDPNITAPGESGGTAQAALPVLDGITEKTNNFTNNFIQYLTNLRNSLSQDVEYLGIIIKAQVDGDEDAAKQLQNIESGLKPDGSE